MGDASPGAKLGENVPEVRAASMLLISAWIHDEPFVPVEYVDQVDPADVAKDLSMVAAALLRCWANEIGIQPTDLLSDLAVGQALDGTSA